MTIEFRAYLIILMIGSVVGLVLFERLNRQLRFVALLLCITFLSESIGRVLIWRIHTSLPVYHFYSPLECFLLMCILASIAKHAQLRKFIFVTYAALIIFCIINSLFIQTFFEYNSNIDKAKMPVTALLAGWMLVGRMNEDLDGPYLLNPDLIILIALFWVNTVSFTSTLITNYLIHRGQKNELLNGLNVFSNFAYYTLLIAAIILFYIKLKPRT